jgi:hypothetical protein
MLQGAWFEQPYGYKVAICQAAAGVPGLPVLINVVPFISQMYTCSVVLFRHRMPALLLTYKDAGDSWV